MDALRLIGEINYDLETGVYKQFPKVGKRMQYIVNKLALSYYVENNELSEGEIETLDEQGYDLN